MAVEHLIAEWARLEPGVCQFNVDGYRSYSIAINGQLIGIFNGYFSRKDENHLQLLLQEVGLDRKLRASYHCDPDSGEWSVGLEGLSDGKAIKAGATDKSLAIANLMAYVAYLGRAARNQSVNTTTPGVAARILGDIFSSTREIK